MLFLKRTLTALVLFFIIAVALFLGTCLILGGIVGARAAAAQHVTGADAYTVGQAAGQQAGRKYGALILLSSVGVSAALSCALAFGGAFPWCRPPPPPPPPLPSRFG